MNFKQKMFYGEKRAVYEISQEMRFHEIFKNKLFIRGDDCP